TRRCGPRAGSARLRDGAGTRCRPTARGERRSPAARCRSGSSPARRSARRAADAREPRRARRGSVRPAFCRSRSRRRSSRCRAGGSRTRAEDRRRARARRARRASSRAGSRATHVTRSRRTARDDSRAARAHARAPRRPPRRACLRRCRYPSRPISSVGTEPLKAATTGADRARMDLNMTLLRAAEIGASDVHFKAAQPPMLRVDGDIQALDRTEPLGEAELREILDTVTAAVPERRRTFDETGELDLSYTAKDLPRFRVNAFKQRGQTSFAFRLIPRRVPSYDELKLPTGVGRLAREHRGLVLVTGATGSGKSTTLA